MNKQVFFFLKHKNVLEFVFFFSLSIIGFFLYNDYGVSLDEDAYKYNGLTDYNFLKNIIFNFNSISFEEIYKNYIIESAKISSLFYLLVFFIKDFINFVFHIEVEIRTISHILLYLFFVLGNFCFFRIIQHRFKNTVFSYLAVLILVTSPRIFSESFYNNRDIFFLSISLINLFCFYKLINNFNFKNIFLYSFLIAISINLRLFGFVFFILSFLLFILEFENKITIKELYIKLFSFLLITSIIFILLTPYLWIDSYKNFLNFYFYDATKTTNIRVSNLFLGEFYSSQFSPISYYFFWILFTTPLVIFILSFIGFIKKLISYLIKLFYLETNKNLWTNKDELFDFFIFLNFFLIFFIMSRFSEVKYDGWRHIYFLYPLLIINLFYILDFLRSKKINIYKLLILIIIIEFFYNINWIYKNHPYQYVYFNYLNKIFSKKKFDLDYWGISNYQIYKYLLKNDQSQKITLGTISFNDLSDNFNILKADEKIRIVLTSKEDLPNYLIDNFRVGYKKLKFSEGVKKNILKDYKLLFQIVIDDNIVSSIYKRK